MLLLDKSVTAIAKAHGIVATKFWTYEGEFVAYRAACGFLTTSGFSVGRSARIGTSGIMFGDYDIQKWHNLTRVHRMGLHGVMWGNQRTGPVSVALFGNTPKVGIEAFTRGDDPSHV
jgi:hypothetical protein